MATVTQTEQVECSGTRGNVIAAELTPAANATERGVLVLASELWPAVLTSRLAAEGLDVLVVSELPEGDREALADMEAACDWLKRERNCDEVFALGAGDGGTRAFLLACAASVLDGVVNVDGPLQLAELSRERPFQPLEMALSLSCPLLALFSDGNASIPAEDQARGAEVLSQFARTFDIVARSGDGRIPLSDAEIDRILAFLNEAVD